MACNHRFPGGLSSDFTQIRARVSLTHHVQATMTAPAENKPNYMASFCDTHHRCQGAGSKSTTIKNVCKAPVSYG